MRPASKSSRCSKSLRPRSIPGSRITSRNRRRALFDGQTVLVCDVGGGTSDFTLIRVQREGDRVEFTRTAVGKHLLLGGDNLDLTLTWLVESKLGTTLSLRQRSGLAAAMRGGERDDCLPIAKLQKVEITVLGAGTGLIGGTLRPRSSRRSSGAWRSKASFRSARSTKSRRKRSAASSANSALPYVSDPAVTRHLAAFLEHDRRAARTRFSSTAASSSRTFCAIVLSM